MKKLVLIVLCMIVGVFLSGCGTTYQAYSNVMKMKKRVDADLNLQTAAPDLKPYAQYAVTPLAKDIYKYVDMFNTDPELIPAKLMDPAVNKEAAEQVEKDIAEAKKEMTKTFKQNGSSPAMLAQTMKMVEDSLNKPYWVVTELPAGSFEGIIRYIEPMVTQYYSSKGGKSVYFRYGFDNTTPEQLRADLIAALDSFILHDSGWVKKEDVMKDSYASSILTIQDTISLQKNVIAENEKNPDRKAYVEQTKRDLQKNENMLAYFEKMKAQNISPITMYKYTWNSTGQITGGKLPNMFSVVLIVKNDNITLNMMKQIYE